MSKMSHQVQHTCTCVIGECVKRGHGECGYDEGLVKEKDQNEGCGGCGYEYEQVDVSMSRCLCGGGGCGCWRWVWVLEVGVGVGGGCGCDKRWCDGGCGKCVQIMES